MKRAAVNGALGRFRVIDLSQVRAGPTCVKQFADFGADVIKVEPPDCLDRKELYVGERDGADMQNLHRNKRSVTLDLKNPRGREALLRLVETADVVVENFRPDVKERLGLGYDTLAAVNPRIVLISISGFGQEGPYRKRPGFDQILQGMCGLMSATGFPDGPPTRAGAAVVDMCTGLYAALGGLTALLEREASGRGQWVQASLLHSGIALMDFQAARCAIDGQVAVRVGNDHPTSMPTSAYPTRDGYINIGAGGDRQWAALCSAIGRPELARDPRFDTDPKRSRNRAELNQILAREFRRHTTAHWIDAVSRSDVPCGPIYTMDQVIADPQVRQAGVFAVVEHPRRGPLPLVNQAAHLRRTPARLEFPLEDKGNSTDFVLAELRYSEAEIQAMRADRVID